MNTIRKLLGRNNFWPLFGAQVLGALNDNIFRTALATYIVFQLPHLSPAAKGILSPLALGLMMLPYFLFSSLSGEIADHFRKSTLVKIYKVTELIVMFFGALGFILGNPYFLLPVVFLMGMQATFFGPVKYSLLPETLPKEELIAANSLIEGSTFTAIVTGALIGGILASIFPHARIPLGNYLVAAIIMVVAMLGLWTAAQLPASGEGDKNLKINPKIWQSTSQIIRSARKNESIWLCILGLSWFWLLGGMFLSLLPLLIQQVLNGTAAIYNFLLVIFAIGVAMGALSCQWLLKGRISTYYVPWAAILIAMLMINLSFLIMSLTPGETTITLWRFLRSGQGWHLMLTLLLISIFGGFYMVPQNAMLQYLSPPEETSRVIAANNIMNALFMSAASIATGIFLAMGGSLAIIFAVLTVGSILIALLSLFLLPEHLARVVCVIFLKFVYRIQVKGLQNIKNIGGPALIVSNHTSFMDGALFVGFIPRRITFAIDKKWAARIWLRPVLRFVKVLPIDPVNPMATRALIDELKNGGLVVIFPEGRITDTGNIMKIYDGSSMIADKAKVPVICAHIGGGEYTIFGRFDRSLKKRPNKKLTLFFNEPVTLDIPQDLTGKERRGKVSDEIYLMMRRASFDASLTDTDIWSAFKNTVSEQGKGRDAIYDSTSRPVKYGKILNRAKILGYAVRKTTRQGENIGVLLPNTSITVILFMALSSIGCIPAMLNYSQGVGPMKAALQTADIKKVYTSREFIQKGGLGDLIKQLPAEFIYLEDLKIRFMDKVKGWFSYNTPPHPDVPAVILFTSGSEGVPKGVVLSHKNILSNLYQHTCTIDFSEKDTLFNALPMFHAFGLNTGTLVPLICGAKLVLYPDPLHVRLIPEVIYEKAVTVIVGTDTFLKSWGLAADPYDFYNVRYIFSGGEKVKDTTVKLYSEKFGCKIYEGYGVTEASPVLAANTLMHSRPGMAGRFLDRIKYRLEPLEGLTTKDKDKGVLLVSGPNIMLGYLDPDNPGKIKKSEGEWYNTGDIISVDNDGYIKIEGRQKRFAKIGGEMVSLEAVESVAQKIWPNINQAVLSISEDDKREVLVLVSEKEDATLGDLWKALKESGFSEIAWPKMFIHISEMPITPLGKVNYPKLTDLVHENTTEK